MKTLLETIKQLIQSGQMSGCPDGEIRVSLGDFEQLKLWAAIFGDDGDPVTGMNLLIMGADALGNDSQNTLPMSAQVLSMTVAAWRRFAALTALPEASETEVRKQTMLKLANQGVALAAEILLEMIREEYYEFFQAHRPQDKAKDNSYRYGVKLILDDFKLDLSVDIAWAVKRFVGYSKTGANKLSLVALWYADWTPANGFANPTFEQTILTYDREAQV